MIRKVIFSLMLLALITSISCTKGNSPVSPSETPQVLNSVNQTEPGVHSLWFYTFLYVDPATLEMKVIPARDVTTHWNVLKWLEQSPCMDCVALTGAERLINNNLLVSVEITHPFTNSNLAGFDVRGIAMFKGTQSFPINMLKTSSILKDEGELVNADGYTSLYNSTTAGSGPNGLQGYLNGKLAGGVPDSTVNGFKMFNTDDGWNLRNYFVAGTSITADYEIHMPPKPFIMGYAVDASWVTPDVKPVENPNTDFPPEANCPEPWKVVVAEDPASNTLTDQGGLTSLTVDVYDHQGKDSYYAPTAECPGLFTGLQNATWVEDTTEYTRYTIDVLNTQYAPAGSYKVLVAVEDKDNDSSPDYLDLTAYQVTTVLVTPDSALHGWAISFGGTNPDALLDSITDEEGNVYVTGYFTFTADFDPGPGVANRTATSIKDAYVAKYDKDGNYIWAGSWGAESAGVSLAIFDDNLYVCGYFRDSDVDFDPGTGTENHSSLGLEDVYVSVFDLDGNHQWTRTWGGYYEQIPGGMAIDALGRIYIAGCYRGVSDFDPGPGKVEPTSVGGLDCFLQRLDSDCQYQWVEVWGGTGEDHVYGMSGSPSGETWLTGDFWWTVDFNPEAEEDNHTSAGSRDSFAMRFDPNGNFKWASTWGSTNRDNAQSIVHDILGYCWIIGTFEDTIDLDPGTGTEEQPSWGSEDIYLLKLDPFGDYVWSGTMGGTSHDRGNVIAMDSLGDVYFGGNYSDTADLDPGMGVENFTSEGGEDPFLVKLGPTADFLWGDVWGGDAVLGLYVDDYAKAYVGGQFYNEADLDPGPGVDMHYGSGTEAFLNVIPRTGVW